MTQPNIILITTDQQRFDCLSCNGHPVLRTPFLDSLAARGVNFTRAYTASPVCIPARRTILSGLHPSTHGLITNAEAQPFTPPATLPRLLRDSGYQTQLVGKLHVAEPGVRHGFDHMFQSETPNDRRQTAHQRRNDYADWFHRQCAEPHTLALGQLSNERTSRPWTLDERLHHTNWVTATAADFLERARDPACPFFLHLSYWAPHQPALPPQCYWDRYAHHGWEPTIGDWVGEREWRPGIPTGSPRGPFRADEMHDHNRGYFGLINHVDDQLNHLFDRWSCSRLSDRDRPTWIVFASDHGEQAGEHHLFRKTLPYEGSAHVPMFVAPLHGARVERPGESDALVGLEDILPTCCELAGVAVPEHIAGSRRDGRSLLPMTRGEGNDRSAYHGESAWRGQHFRYLVQGERKYIRWTGTGEEQAFDLADDPRECHDRSGDLDLAEYRSAVDAWRDGGVTAEHDGDATPHPCAGAVPQAVWG